MGSCCRRPVRSTQGTQNICGSLSLSTGVSFRLTGPEPEAVIFLGSDGLSVTDMFSKFGCAALQTAGVRLADMTSRALHKAWQENPVAVTALLDKRMPMLIAKQKLFNIITKCATCNGMGCPLCGNLGFNP